MLTSIGTTIRISVRAAILGTVLFTLCPSTAGLAAPPPPPPPCPGGGIGCPTGPGVQPPPVVPPWTPPDQIAAGLRTGAGQPGPPTINTTPTSPTYVRVVTEFYVDARVWAPLPSVSNNDPTEPVIVTVAPAKHGALTWDVGDSSPSMTCDGPGGKYKLDCTHTYQRSSAAQASGTYTINVVMHWTVTWSCNAPNCRGQNFGYLAPIDVPATAQLTVGEIQSNSSPGA
jgi:hypothetical protein